MRDFLRRGFSLPLVALIMSGALACKREAPIAADGEAAEVNPRVAFEAACLRGEGADKL